jgi:N-acetyl-anhydromuramyl-L-alanine amidase AmpD
MTWILPESERLLSPNRNTGRKLHTARVLVLHYAVDGDNTKDDPESDPWTAVRPRDATPDCMDVARLFARRSRKASAHFVIGRDGSKVQCVPLSDTAWHAGGGKFPMVGTGPLKAGVTSINQRSVGIEICNAGWAVDALKIPTANRVRLAHPATPRSKQNWETYRPAQYSCLGYIAALLRLSCPTLSYVTGHEDVVNRNTLGVRYGGKVDPGPAFDWDAINWRQLGYTPIRYDFKTKAWVTR